MALVFCSNGNKDIERRSMKEKVHGTTKTNEIVILGTSCRSKYSAFFAAHGKMDLNSPQIKLKVHIVLFLPFIKQTAMIATLNLHQLSIVRMQWEQKSHRFDGVLAVLIELIPILTHFMILCFKRDWLYLKRILFLRVLQGWLESIPACIGPSREYSTHWTSL